MTVGHVVAEKDQAVASPYSNPLTLLKQENLESVVNSEVYRCLCVCVWIHMYRGGHMHVEA